MAKFEIKWTENVYYKIVVDGDSMEEVLDKFHSGEYDLDYADNYGVELEDSIEVTEKEGE